MPLLDRTQRSPLERRTAELGADLLARARRHEQGALSSGFWRDKLVGWAMRNEAFKVQLFRFVDAFPMLRNSEQVHAYLTDYLAQPGVEPPPMLSLGLKAGGLARGALAKTITAQVQAMAQRFIAGRDAASALPALENRWAHGLAFSVDLLGEACVSDDEADAYRRRYLDLIHTLPERVAAWPSRPQLERDHLGPLPRVNVSLKISSIYARTDPADFDRTIAGLLEVLTPVLQAAAAQYVFINFDIEQHALKALTFELFKRCCEQVDFPAGLAVQAYLRSGDADAEDLVAWSLRSGRPITVRLVKGAYWDYETIHAEQMGWPVPVWAHKHETDACFERMTRTFLASTPRSPGQGGVTLAVGSHNARSIAHALAVREAAELPPEALELQMLYGMAEPLKAAAAELDLRVREYVPVGEMIPGMAYLVRRLLENTSNESWLRAGFSEDTPIETLLASPHTAEEASPPPARNPGRHALSPAVAGLGGGQPFFNEPLRDFADRAQRERFAAAAQAAQVPTIAQTTTTDDAVRVVGEAAAAFPTWRDTPALERAQRIVRAAALMRQRRDELAGVIIREAGKPWRGADADVCEAIDFCEYYARWAVRLFEPERLGRLVGELDEQWHEPRGVAVVISPWNFPLAICTGMTVAALVTGNTVVVKPAEQTPGIASLMCELLWEAGVPRGALHFLLGQGETVGAALVRDPRVATIAFTGSKAVGLDILAATSQPPEANQPFIKRAICEMGGKNAIIIDDAADLDEAVLAVRESAFGFAGQKCSACSRVIVVDAIHDTFLARLIASTRSLVVGDPLEPGTDVGPVIDAEAAAKIRAYLDIGQQEGQLALAVDVPAELEQRIGKPFVGPHIFTDIEPHHRLAQEEVFGPVLAVMRAANFDDALRLVNATAYKLTGGVFSRRPAHLAQAKRTFRVGNLYLNRGITGALVGRQPFGGFGLSGVGAKAGGRAYLQQFVDPRASCENTMRRGFAPEISD